MLGWDITYTNLFMGGLLIIYTVSGGAKADESGGQDAEANDFVHGNLSRL